MDWPVIILLGAMIPVGEALETTGGAARIAMLITDLGNALPPVGDARRDSGGVHAAVPPSSTTPPPSF